MKTLQMRADLHLLTAQSLKAKRSVVTPIVKHLDRMAGVAAAEIGSHELWQRTTIGISVVGATPSHQQQVMDTVERYIWSRADIEVLEMAQYWWEEE